jgi:hypothetical protein
MQFRLELAPNHPRGGFNYLTQTQRARDTFTYTIINSQGGTSTATVTVNIQGVNDAPILNDMTINVDENTAMGAVLGSIIPIHADLNDIVFTSIIGGDTGFSVRNIKDSRGFFRYAEVILERGLDFEAQNTFSFTVSGRDYVGATDTAVITIKVNDVNEAPSLNDQSFQVDEHSDNGSLVGQVITTDPDFGQSLTYEIVAGNEAGIFAIDAATGKVSVANSLLLDYESLSSHQLTVKVTDSGTGNLTDTGVVTINVLDKNEAPVL